MVKKSQSAFTIVELLVVIVVIGILAAITIISYTGISNRANISSLQSDLANASKLLKLYQAEHDSYPTQMNGNCPQLPQVDDKYCLKPSSNSTFSNYTGTVSSFGLNETRSGITYRVTEGLAPFEGIGGIDQYTKLMLHGENLLDSSEISKNLTNFGTVAVNTSVKKFGTSSIQFSGTNYLSLADDVDWNFTAGDYTIDCWLYIPTVGTARMGIFSNYSGAGIGNIQLELNTQGGGSFQTFAQSSSGFSNIESADGTITSNSWYHIAFVRNGNLFTQYVNGVSVGSDNQSITLQDPTNTLYVGYTAYQTKYLTGYIDELRVSKGIARWTSNFTPPTQPYTN